MNLDDHKIKKIAQRLNYIKSMRDTINEDTFWMGVVAALEELGVNTDNCVQILKTMDEEQIANARQGKNYV